MTRLIDAEEVKKFANSLDTLSENQLIDVLYVIANEIPTVDAVPVTHGHWINHYDDLFPEESTRECSVCHAEQMVTMLDDNYCPHCGAKMERKEK